MRDKRDIKDMRDKGHCIKTENSSAMRYNTFCIALSGRLFDVTITHRVAVGCYALPFQGGGKNLQSYCSQSDPSVVLNLFWYYNQCGVDLHEGRHVHGFLNLYRSR
jgi:hypothetical protein